MLLALRLRWHITRMERTFELWRSRPLPPPDPAEAAAQVPCADVLTVDQFAQFAGVREDLAKAFLDRKAAEFGIESKYEYFQGGPFWIEYPFPKKSAVNHSSISK